MFLKSISFTKGIVFTYLNEDEKLNKIVACRMLEQLYSFKFELEKIYTFFLGENFILSKLSFDSQFETVNICGGFKVANIVGTFNFSHEFKQFGIDEIENLIKQNLYDSAHGVRMANEVYEKLVALSDFINENLATIMLITSDQMSLFDANA